MLQLLADGEWWRPFGNDPSYGYAVVISAIPFIVGPIWFFYKVIKSVKANANLRFAPKPESIDASGPRDKRLSELPEITKPVHEYVLRPGYVRDEDIQHLPVADLLNCFERRVLLAKLPELTFRRFKGNSHADTSFVIAYRATATISFLGWLVLQEEGASYNWQMRASEFRAVRNPEQGNSHFSYAKDHEHRLYNSMFKRKGDDSGFDFLWDISTGNVMTDTGAQKAEWFRGFLTQRLNEALDDLQSLKPTQLRQMGAELSHVHRSEVASNPSIAEPRRRRRE